MNPRLRVTADLSLLIERRPVTVAAFGDRLGGGDRHGFDGRKSEALVRLTT
jgi:hypothetical protein